MSFETRRRGLRRLNPSFGRPEYPSPTAGDGNYIQSSRINDGTDPGEFFYRCKQCGFPLLAERVQSPGGTPDGNGGIRVVVTAGVGDPQNEPGYCHFCGTANSKSQGGITR